MHPKRMHLKREIMNAPEKKEVVNASKDRDMVNTLKEKDLVVGLDEKDVVNVTALELIIDMDTVTVTLLWSMGDTGLLSE